MPQALHAWSPSLWLGQRLKITLSDVVLADLRSLAARDGVAERARRDAELESHASGVLAAWDGMLGRG
jgi:hypothetical protein